MHSTLTREEELATTPKNDAKHRNYRASHDVQVQAIPVHDGRLQPGGASYPRHSRSSRGCTHFADSRLAIGIQLPAGQSSQGTQKVGPGM